MIPILGPIVAALGGALGIGAGGAAATGLGSLLGNAWLPALGTGIGTLLTGGSGKDALRNAAIAGGGSMLFPGVGKSVSGGISQLLGIGGQQLSGPRDMGMAARFAPPDNPNRSGSTAPVNAPATLPPALGIAAMSRTGSATPGDRQDPMNFIPGISSMSRTGSATPGDRQSPMGFTTPRMGSATLGDRQSPMGFTPEIPQMESSPYESPYAAMMRGEEDRQKRAGEDLLRYSPDVTQTSSERKFDLGNRSLDLMYQGYNERPDIMSGDVDPSIAKELPYIDPYTMKRFATKEERDAAMEQTSAYRASDAPLRTYIARKYATGGEIQGPGTGTSDSVPATIYQNGTPVKKAALSDGEFVMTAKAVRGMGNGSRERGVTRMYELMRRFENGEMA